MSQPRQGLFAFDGDRFHHHFQDTPELEHVEWFEAVGLPSSGPEYDALLRGKVTWDMDTDRVVLGFYGTAYLSNNRYSKIVEVFEVDESKVVEKMLNEPY
jgi:hypothetical protein